MGTVTKAPTLYQTITYISPRQEVEVPPGMHGWGLATKMYMLFKCSRPVNGFIDDRLDRTPAIAVLVALVTLATTKGSYIESQFCKYVGPRCEC